MILASLRQVALPSLDIKISSYRVLNALNVIACLRRYYFCQIDINEAAEIVEALISNAFSTFNLSFEAPGKALEYLVLSSNDRPSYTS